MQETLDMGEKQVYEVEIMSGHGELRSVLVSVAPLLNDAGGQQGVLGIARDITERKQLEQQVQILSVWLRLANWPLVWPMKLIIP